MWSCGAGETLGNIFPELLRRSRMLSQGSRTEQHSPRAYAEGWHNVSRRLDKDDRVLEG